MKPTNIVFERWKRFPTWLLLFCLFAAPDTQAQVNLTLQPVTTALLSPVSMTHSPDKTNRLFVCEQQGTIRILKPGKSVPELFLDIRRKIVNQFNVYSERGLLGLAFHPDYRNNRRFYVYYSAPSKLRGSNHKCVIAEYKASASDPDKALPEEKIILEIEQPESNHNGGQLAFGPDGYLYIASGDGGGANDEHGRTGNGQNLETLLGKILRIDVNTHQPYAVPADNPFVNKPGRDEIWAYGLRNPWCFSFDKNGNLFCADVGQDEYEEIDLIKRGRNYGWRVMEGFHCFNPPAHCNTQGLELPIYEYNHDEGKCIIGGYVYRGPYKAWHGKYFFADWTGKIFVISSQNGKWIKEAVNWNSGKVYFNSFGEDEAGNLYLLGQYGLGPEKKSVVFRLEPAAR